LEIRIEAKDDNMDLFQGEAADLNVSLPLHTFTRQGVVTVG